MKGFIEVTDISGTVFLVNVSQVVYANGDTSNQTVICLTTGKIFTIKSDYPQFVQLINSAL
jgi:hypothetical protein